MESERDDVAYDGVTVVALGPDVPLWIRLYAPVASALAGAHAVLAVGALTQIVSLHWVVTGVVGLGVWSWTAWRAAKQTARIDYARGRADSMAMATELLKVSVRKPPAEMTDAELDHVLAARRAIASARQAGQ